jgi:tRNA dimethylallyltransferase
VASIAEVYSAGDYARAARAAIAGIVSRGRLPIVTGGSGLYLRALLQGLFPGPKRSEPLRERLRRNAEERGAKHLHRVLRRLDPASAERIHENDVPKVIRAIEVSLAGSEPMSQAWQRTRDPLEGFRILRVGLAPDRQELYARINQRAAKMFEDGLIEETRKLIAGTLLAGAADSIPPALASLGYRQAVEYIRGGLSLEQAVAGASQGHRNYAKRQLTWFRREPDVTWLNGFGDNPAIAEEAANLVKDALGGNGG